MSVKLILIRHGQTSWNARKIYCGAKDIGLNANGKRQAALLNKQFTVRVHEVYSSDKKRAVQTARIIFNKRKIKQLAGLREMNFGIFEGLNHRQILRKYPKIYSQWLKDPFSVIIPKGEGLYDFRDRVVKAMKKISKLHPKQTVAVVCHGGVIGIFLTYLRNEAQRAKARGFLKRNTERPRSIRTLKGAVLWPRMYKNNFWKLIPKSGTSTIIKYG